MKIPKVTGALVLLLSLSIISVNAAFAGEGQWRGVDYGNDNYTRHHDNSPRSHYPTVDYSNNDSEEDNSADDTSDEPEMRTPCVENWRCKPTSVRTGNRWFHKWKPHKTLPPER